jgi:hypothetical protein
MSSFNSYERFTSRSLRFRERFLRGDSAVIASASGRSMIALVSGGEACARFLAPDFVLSMLTQVGKGVTEAAGDPI